MSAKLYGVIAGFGIGFVFAWAGLSDPAVIRDMLLLRDPHVFLLMGSAIVVAGIGARLLRATGVRSLAGHDAIAWTVETPQPRHVAGSLLFGAGWSLAGTCPGPVAVMVGEGHLSGLLVVAGLIAGVSLLGWYQRSNVARQVVHEAPGTAGL